IQIHYRNNLVIQHFCILLHWRLEALSLFQATFLCKPSKSASYKKIDANMQHIHAQFSHFLMVFLFIRKIRENKFNLSPIFSILEMDFLYKIRPIELNAGRTKLE